MGCSVLSKPTDDGLVSNPTVMPSVRVPSSRTRTWTIDGNADDLANGNLQFSLASLNEERTETGVLSVGAIV